MKITRETGSTILSNEEQLSDTERGARSAVIRFLHARKELAVVVVVGTCAILSVLFLLVCLRTMIPVEGLINSDGVRIGNDFIVFYSSAILAAGGDAASAYDQVILNAYQLDVLGVEPEDLPWRYPPVYFFILLPFAFLSYLVAYWVWSGLTIMGLMIMARRITPVWYLPFLVPLCLPVAYAMVAGQNGSLTAILIGAGLIMLPRSEILAGIILGVLVYKPQLAVVIPFCLLAGRYYGAFISMGVTAVVLMLLSLFVFGVDAWLAFFQGLSEHSTSAFGAADEIWGRIPTVAITALQLFDSSRTAWVVQACVALFAITLAAWVWRTTSKLDARALALVAATPLISPYILDYDMVILIIPIAFLANDAFMNKWTVGRMFILLSMWFAEPTLRLMSESIGLQLGPFLWVILLGYSVILAQQEQCRMDVRKC